ncbi:hypothetical protein GCM10027059_09630 [Myceligenerans halotolerans]
MSPAAPDDTVSPAAPDDTVSPAAPENTENTAETSTAYHESRNRLPGRPVHDFRLRAPAMRPLRGTRSPQRHDGAGRDEYSRSAAARTARADRPQGASCRADER